MEDVQNWCVSHTLREEGLDGLAFDEGNEKGDILLFLIKKAEYPLLSSYDSCIRDFPPAFAAAP